MKGTYTITFRLDWVLSFRGGLGGSPVRLLADALRKEFPQAEISQDSANVVTMACGEAGKPEQEVRERIGACMQETLGVLPDGTDVTLAFEGEEGAGAAPAAEEAPAAPEKPQTHVDESSMQWLNDLASRFQKGGGAAAPKAESAPQQQTKEAQALPDVFEKIVRTRRVLNEKIYGQQHAVNAFTEGLFGVRVFADREKERKGPKGVFLFAGPPGVGKTFLAETAAEELGLPFLRVDMSEYSGSNAVEEFIGTDAIYKGSKPGRVTGFVDEHPECLLLFDEIEKAHLTTIQLFLQLLEGARLRDVCMNKEISFRDVIIIMTTNAGHNLYEETDSVNLSGISAKTVINALKTDINPYTNEPYFPAAIVSRLASGTVIMFNHLEPFSLRDIVTREMRGRIGLLEREYGFSVEVDYPKVASAILYSEGGAADARTLKGAASGFVRRELLGLFSQFRSGSVREELKKLKTIRITVDEKDGTPEASALFAPKSKKTVLVFCGGARKKALSGYTCGEFSVEATDDLLRAQELLRGNLACAVTDVFCNVHEDGFLPSDPEDVDSDGVRLFRYAREYFPELPVYVVNTAEKENDRFLSFIASGARDVLIYPEDGTQAFAETLMQVCQNAVMAESAYKLARANKILSFNAEQYFSDGGKTAEIRLTSFSLKRAVRAEDKSSVLEDTSLPDVHFSDVIGAKDAKESLQEFVRYLKDPVAYLTKGVRPPRGVLLYGPPGTGKTFLAKAMAGESDVAFIQKNATEFFHRLVGEGPRLIRSMFSTARRYAPSIIFIDEVDAFARARTGSEAGQFAAEILNTFLSEMDGFVFDEKRPVFVLAATNFDIAPGRSNRVLDPAFVRRFDRKIKVDLPDTEEREQFIAYYLKRHGIEDISASAIRNLALRSYGKSPADLEMVVEYAIRSAKGEKLTDEILEKALDADAYGEENEWREETVRQTAFHEAGHTLISWLNGKKPTYVTIISRGGFGGYMLNEIDDKKFGYTRQEMRDEICTVFGGRAAEVVFYGAEGVSTGASSDLRKATALARDMLSTYGMDEAFGYASFEENAFGERVEEAVFRRVSEILKEEYARAVRLIEENKAAMQSLAGELIRKNSLTAEEIETVLSPFRAKKA